MCTLFNIKCCFFFFNTLFLMSGVALITIGVLQYSTYSEIGTFAGSSLSQIAIVIIAVGVTIAFISLLGHTGAFFNNFVLVACFICILIVIILLEVLTGAAFYIFRSRVRHVNPPKRELLEIKTALLQMNSAVNTKARAVISDYSPERRHAINTIQEKFKCCGADSYADWSQSVGWENHNAVPDSCCVVKSEGCGQEKEKAHKKGCLWAIKFFLMKNLVWVAAVCIALGVTEVFGVLIGVCLCLEIKSKDYKSFN